MKKLLLAVIMLLAFTSNASSAANKPVIFGLQITDGIELADGDDAPRFRDEAGYRMYLALTASTMFAITPTLAIRSGFGIQYRSFEFDMRDTVNYMGVPATGRTTGSDARIDEDYSVGLTIPVMARYYFTDGLFGELGTIIDVNFFEKFSPFYADDWVDIDTQETVYVGIGASLGYTFRFGLEVNGNFTYGVTNLYSDQDWVGHRINLNIAYWFNYR